MERDKEVAVAMQQDQTITVVIEAIQSYNFDHVRERIVRKKLLSEDIVDEAIAEYKRYMTMNARTSDRLTMFSEPIDEVWHQHILFTRDYANFCEKAVGHFVHHDPMTPEQQRKGRKERAERFYEMYVESFHTLPSAIWHGLIETCCSGGC